MKNELQLPPGYTSRPVTLDDVEAAAELINDSTRPITGLDGTTATEKYNAWTTPGLNIATDTQFVLAVDGAPAGLLEYWDIQESHIQSSLALYLHPALAPNEIGAYLLDWADCRVQTTLDLAPAGEQVDILVGVDGRDKTTLALLRTKGYFESRHFWQMLLEMIEPPAPAVWPVGIDSREYIVGQDERPVHETTEASFADHWRHVPISFEQWLHWNIEHEEFDPSLWAIALENSDIVGALVAWPNLDGDSDTGFISDLGVRPGWRGCGIGQALLHQSFATFYRRGVYKVALTVDTESTTGATRLYQRVGMRPVQQRVVFEKVAGFGLDPTIELGA